MSKRYCTGRSASKSILRQILSSAISDQSLQTQAHAAAVLLSVKSIMHVLISIIESARCMSLAEVIVVIRRKSGKTCLSMWSSRVSLGTFIRRRNTYTYRCLSTARPIVVVFAVNATPPALPIGFKLCFASLAWTRRGFAVCKSNQNDLWRAGRRERKARGRPTGNAAFLRGSPT